MRIHSDFFFQIVDEKSKRNVAAAFSFDVKPLSYFELFEERLTKLPPLVENI